MAKYEVNQTLTFNTHRPYTPEGQTLECVVLEYLPDEDGFDLFDEYKVKFTDTARGITGVVVVIAFTEQEIMAAYDANQYTTI
ncbi:hypothetical protein VH22019_00102 [Vibrio phage VH2_2019]|nr:hypothetical protein VH22019_00102 [Vibrio phage VH2_2019]